VIVHEPSKDWAPPQDHDIYDDITAARLQQNIDTPVDERITYATWPETVVYFSTLTMNERYATREIKELYQYSFREYLDRWTPLDPDEQPSPLQDDPDLSTYQRDRLDDLRFGIKKDRDQYFVDNLYDDLDIETVPKSFWLTDYELKQETDAPDDYAQSALDEYVD